MIDESKLSLNERMARADSRLAIARRKFEDAQTELIEAKRGYSQVSREFEADLRAQLAGRPRGPKFALLD